MAAMPIVGMLVSKFDARKVLAFGFLCGCGSMYLFSRLNLNAGYWDIFWPQVIQGVAMASMFTPLAAASVSHIAKERMGNATSIVNLMRNIGGSFGIASMTTFLARRAQWHQSHLVEHVSAGDPAARQMLDQYTAYFRLQGADAATAAQRAYGAIYLQLQKQASMLSFVDVFWVMGALFVVVLPSLIMLRDPRIRTRVPPSSATRQVASIEESATTARARAAGG